MTKSRLKEIAAPPQVSAMLRKLVTQSDAAQAMARCAIEAVALTLEVPSGYTFDVERMVFRPPGKEVKGVRATLSRDGAGAGPGGLPQPDGGKKGNGRRRASRSHG